MALATPVPLLAPSNGAAGSGVPQYGITPANPVPSQLPQVLGLHKPLIGQWKSPVLDFGQAPNILARLNIRKITGASAPPQATLLNGVASPATLQIEGSADGNDFVKITSPAYTGLGTGGVATGQEGPVDLGSTVKPMHRFFQTRLVLAGGAAVMGAAVTATGTPLQNGTACKVSPDGQVLFFGSSTTGFLQAFPVTSTTGALGAAVAAAAQVGTVNDIDVLQFTNSAGVTTYWLLLALAASPFWGIVSYTAAGGFGTAFNGSVTLAGAGLAAKWVPNIANPATQVGFIGFTGGAALAGVVFNLNTGLIAGQCSVTLLQNGQAAPAFGANVNGIDVALDGSYLVTAESSAPFFHVVALNANANASTPMMGYAQAASTSPGSSCAAAAIHPSGEVVSLANGANALSYPVYRNAGPYTQAPFEATGTTNPAGFSIGTQQVKAGGIGTLSALAYHPNGSALAICGAGAVANTPPFVATFPVQDFATAHLGTAETAPAAITNATAGKKVAWNPLGQHLYQAATSSLAAGSIGGWPWLMDACVGVVPVGTTT